MFQLSAAVSEAMIRLGCGNSVSLRTGVRRILLGLGVSSGSSVSVRTGVRRATDGPDVSGTICSVLADALDSSGVGDVARDDTAEAVLSLESGGNCCLEMTRSSVWRSDAAAARLWSRDGQGFETHATHHWSV